VLLDSAPPHDLQLEQALIGSIMLDAAVIDDVEPIVAPEDCYAESHRIVLETLYRMRRSRQPIDAITVLDELQGRKLLEQVGGPEALDRMFSCVPSTSHAVEYARRVKDYSLSRSLLRASIQTIERIQKARPEQVRELIGDAEASLHKLDLGGTKDEFQPMRVCIQEAMRDTERMYEMQEARKRGEVLADTPALEWGIPALDEVCAILVGDLTVIGGASSMGKSALAKVAAVHNARKGVGCIVASMDDRRAKLGQRSIAQDCQEQYPTLKVSNRQIQSGHALASYGKELWASADRLVNLPMWVSSGRRMSVEDIWARCRRLVSRHGCKLVVVDYLQSLRINARSRAEEIAEACVELKDMARDLDVAVVALSQLTEKAMMMRIKDNPPCFPRPSDLKESGAIYEASETVIMPYRRAHYDTNADPAKAILRVVKNKNGPKLDVEAGWHGPSCSYVQPKIYDGAMP